MVSQVGSAAAASDSDTASASLADRPAIQVADLSKRYGSLEAVNGVSFSVGQGEVFACLGPNGAGKSTTIKMLCTLVTPTSGAASVAGFDVARQPRSARQRIGLVFQDETLDHQLTAEENLRFHAVLYRVPRDEVAGRVDRALELVDLADRRRSLVSTFSGGMARRLEIARALLHTPQVLFLDEPTVGLDPQTRARIWEDILRLRDEHQVTIFLTTHYLDEAEYADRIAIIDHGSIIACDTPDALKAAIGGDLVEMVTEDDTIAEHELRRAGYHVRTTPEGLRAQVPSGAHAAAAMVHRVGVGVEEIRIHRPTLDDVFMHYTGREIRDSGGGNSMAHKFVAAQRRR